MGEGVGSLPLVFGEWVWVLKCLLAFPLYQQCWGPGITFTQPQQRYVFIFVVLHIRVYRLIYTCAYLCDHSCGILRSTLDAFPYCSPPCAVPREPLTESAAH